MSDLGIPAYKFIEWLDKQHLKYYYGSHTGETMTKEEHMFASDYFDLVMKVYSHLQDEDINFLPFTSYAHVWELPEAAEKYEKGEPYWHVTIYAGGETLREKNIKIYGLRESYPIRVRAHKRFAEEFNEFIKEYRDKNKWFHSPTVKWLSITALLVTIIGVTPVELITDAAEWYMSFVDSFGRAQEIK